MGPVSSNISQNRPNVLLVDNSRCFGYMTDITFPHNNKIEEKYVDRKGDYLPLTREIIINIFGICSQFFMASLDFDLSTDLSMNLPSTRTTKASFYFLSK